MRKSFLIAVCILVVFLVFVNFADARDRERPDRAGKGRNPEDKKEAFSRVKERFDKEIEQAIAKGDQAKVQQLKQKLSKLEELQANGGPKMDGKGGRNGRPDFGRPNFDGKFGKH